MALPYWPGTTEDYARLYDGVVASCPATQRVPTPGGLVVLPCMECAACLQLIDQTALNRYALLAPKRESFLAGDTDEEKDAADALAQVFAPAVERIAWTAAEARRGALHEQAAGYTRSQLAAVHRRAAWAAEAAAWATKDWPELRETRYRRVSK